MKGKKGKSQEVLHWKNVPSLKEAIRDNIRWFNLLTPIKKIRLLQRQKAFLKRLQGRGFTLIELIIVMLLVVIMAAVVISFIFREGTTMTITAMAKKIRADMQYAQELAMARRASSGFTQPVRARVVFDTANEKYDLRMVNDSDGDNKWGEGGEWEYTKDPSTGGDFTVQLNSGNYNGITVDSASFSATGCPSQPVLEFDSIGIPYCVDTTSGISTRIDAEGNVVISKAGESMTIRVTQNTGRVWMQ